MYYNNGYNKYFLLFFYFITWNFWYYKAFCPLRNDDSAISIILKKTHKYIDIFAMITSSQKLQKI